MHEIINKNKIAEINKFLQKQDYYSAHHYLEDIWNSLEKGTFKIYIQALIQLVVALHHKQKTNFKGYKILLEKASEKLNRQFQNSNEVKGFLEKELESLKKG